MTDRRDSTRIVRSWLENGSTGIPDHVLDAAMLEVRSTPQRRRWSPWRTPTMQLFLKLGAVAAVLVVAVVVGRQLLPANWGIAAPNPTPVGAFGGKVTFTLDALESSIDIDATADGTSLSGTATLFTTLGTATLNLECARYDAGTWMFAGKYASTAAGMNKGENGAVFVVDGTPQKVAYMQNAETDPYGPCEQFVAEIESFANFPADAFSTVESGVIVVPPAP